METSVLVLRAASAALWVVDKVSGGALEKAGSDILGLLTKRFDGSLKIADTSSERLQAAILSEVESDDKFRHDLEILVGKYTRLENIYTSQSTVSQDTQSGVNISVSSNSGTVVGQQVENQFFRQ